MVGGRIAPLHNRTRRNAYLVEPKREGEKHRCSICDKPVRTLRYSIRDGGVRREIAVALFCKEHEIIFPFKRIVISKYGGVIIEKRE